MRHEEHDVLVIGGGPAGSSTALRLARLGHRVALVDRAAFPRDKACSEYTSPETVRHLDLLGVLPQLDAAHPPALVGTTVTSPGGPSLTGLFARAGGTPFRSTGLAIRRSVLDQALLDAARSAGVDVFEETTLTSLAPLDATGMTATLRVAGDVARTMRARVVVGADGLRSVVSRRMGLHRQGWLRRVAFSAHLRNVAGLTDRAELHVATHGYVGINPLGDGLANVTLVVPQRAASGARGDAASFLLEQVELFTGARGRLGGASIARGVIATGPFDAMSRHSTTDGVLLVGDAADFFDPFTGEGICSALAGGEMAALVIDHALSRPGPLDNARLAHYRTLRRRAFLGKWVIERMIGYAMLAPSLFDRAVERLERRGMADTLIGVTGHFVSPWRILNPVALAKMIV